MNKVSPDGRHMGLFGATSVGVGAIVGGGILALAGVAFATTGPAAILAFAVNGAIALLTALCFAEMASKFPESGGTYTFSKKVLSVEAAFMVGWVVWFASIVAAVLYAIGFAHFLLVMVDDLWRSVAGPPPDWLANHWTVTGVAVGTTAVLALGLLWKAAGGGHWANIGKVVVFATIIVAGLWAVSRRGGGDIAASMQPFFSTGLLGLIQAMGYTFIALQGFDLIAAVAGEVREPSRNVPRAMVLSLLIALAIYLPLLFIVTTVGTPAGRDVASFAADDPEEIVALAAQNYLGAFGYWLVIVAAVLSMFSALQANLFAASRIAAAMARDHTLPSALSRILPGRGTPYLAVIVSACLVSAILVVLHDVAAAGAASSLIFLGTFALAHWVSVLVRQRSISRPPPFRTPLFPAIPIVGGLACFSLAVFQGWAVPAAGRIAVIWLTIGGFLFLLLFARRARIKDASNTALDLELVSLRGYAPLVLLPVANPQNAHAMVTLAHALVPPDIGRVLMHTVVVPPQDWQPDENPQPIERAHAVLRELLTAAVKVGARSETMITVADRPIPEIARVAKIHQCQSVLLGLSEISEEDRGTRVERLLGTVDADIVVLRAHPNWRLADVKNILVPVAGRGGHDRLIARLLGSLLRTGHREVTLLRVLPERALPHECRRVYREVTRMAEDEVPGRANAIVVQSDDPVAEIAEHAEQCDLLITGVQRLDRRRKLFGNVVRQIAANTSTPMLVVSRRG